MIRWPPFWELSFLALLFGKFEVYNRRRNTSKQSLNIYLLFDLAEGQKIEPSAGVILEYLWAGSW
jgi:hypothetical protein